MGDQISELRKFVAPEIIFGAGAHKMAGRCARNMGGKKILVVTDPGVIGAGWAKSVVEHLESEGLEYTLFSEVSPNPRSTEVMHGVDVYRQGNCDAIVAVGGGSPMDCAKGIGIVVSNKRHILEFEGIDRIAMPVPPLIFIPTTAGTSADVSQFAIITDKEKLVKIAIVSKAIVPDVALVDPEPTTTMDAYLMACTGVDAIVHAIEAFVSTASSPITDMHAVEALKMLARYLPQVKKTPDNMEFREKVMLGSMEAGLAFSNAILGAVHAMAHSLGGFLDLPHGECNAILLEHVIDFNYPSAVEKFKTIAEIFGIDTRRMTPKSIKRALIKAVVDLKEELGIVRKLGLSGLKTADIPLLSRNALKDACLVTNPRPANQRDLEVIYEESL